VEGIAYDSHHRRGFRHEPSVALHHFAKISGAFLVVRAALLGRRFCPARAAVRAVRRSETVQQMPVLCTVERSASECIRRDRSGRRTRGSSPSEARRGPPPEVARHNHQRPQR
jgi:hypothetical protein